MKDQDDATLLSLASEYLEAAMVLHETPPTRINYSAVTFYLLGHAAELFLKGFLYMQGAEIVELRKHGHNLAVLVAQVDQAGFPEDIKLHSIKKLSSNYNSKGLEYRKNMVAEYPGRDSLLLEVKSLSDYVLSRGWSST